MPQAEKSMTGVGAVAVFIYSISPVKPDSAPLPERSE